MSRTAFTLNPPGCGVNECNGDVSSIDTLVCSPAVFVLALVEMREMIFACTSSARGWFYRRKLPLYAVEICRLEHRRNVMVNLRKVVVANDEPEWGGGASKRTLRGRLVQYLPLLGFVFAAVSSTLGAVFLVGGRDLFDFALAYLRRWNTAWMVLSVLAFYVIAYEFTQTQWFRRFGIEMMPERLQGLVLGLALGSFCLVSPFRTVWTNYWLLRDGRQVKAAITDIREHGSVGYRYRVNGNEYTTSAYCPHEGRVSCIAGENITAYYSASHPSVSRIQQTVSMADGAWPAIIFFTWPFEFMAIATVVSPRCKWAYRFGSRNVLPPAMRRAE